MSFVLLIIFILTLVKMITLSWVNSKIFISWCACICVCVDITVTSNTPVCAREDMCAYVCINIDMYITKVHKSYVRNLDSLPS